MVRLENTEGLGTPIERENHVPSVRIQRDHALPGIRLASPNSQGALDQVNVTPAQLFYLAFAHRGI
ncbi:hypothetical protein HDF14_002129 [Edaphobacter lichenicola]|uniref:Uncharacterized protein n=1 Tax=Tunturiibacter gelidiferens TaxID=3069689 RepID=A0A9X0QE02_9BACT|nr:hypothetical protein [Edaphobacter lichenicola]MBB5328519.1 hypothetical protein [Edaphobacter lichenicola]